MLDGRDPGGMVVLHTCDNPQCVNPSHLRVGSQAENVADMHAKGRGNVGSVNGQAKLNEHDVELIKVWLRLGLRQKPIAAYYGVSKGTLTNIARGVVWRQVRAPYALTYAVSANVAHWIARQVMAALDSRSAA
jgi:hypothetical protein